MTNTRRPATPADLAAALGVPLEEVLEADRAGREFVAATDRAAVVPAEARLARRAFWTVSSDIGTQEWSATHLKSGGWSVKVVETIDGPPTTHHVEDVWTDERIDEQADRLEGLI